MPAFRSKVPDLLLPNVSISEFVLGGAAKYGDRVAMADMEGRSYSYNQFVDAVHKCAAGLQVRGLKKGDCMLIFCPNVIDYAVAFHGCALIGGINSTANPTYTEEELLHSMRISEAAYILTIPAFLEKTRHAIAQLPSRQHVREIFVLGSAPGATSFSDLLSNDGKWTRVPIDPLRDVVCLPYSSGTTGLPKAVMLTHHNLVSNILQFNAIELPSHRGTEVFVAILPFFHIYALAVFLLGAIYNGYKFVIMSKFEIDAYLSAIQTHKATILHVAPPVVLALAKHPAVARYDVSSVRVLFSAAAPLGEDLTLEVERRLPSLRVKQGYGMTELSPLSHLSPLGSEKAGSVGILVPNMECKVIALDGRLLGVGEDGEICLRGPNVMPGYYHNAQATAETIDNEQWLHTGDIGHVDVDGNYYIVDRLKELIKYKGYQVAPAELEAILLSSPGIADAAVIGIPEVGTGELPKAFVVLRPGSTLTTQHISAFVNDRVAPHMHLRGGVEFIETIPKSASGKILRRLLRDQEKAKRLPTSKL